MANIFHSSNQTSGLGLELDPIVNSPSCPSNQTLSLFGANATTLFYITNVFLLLLLKHVKRSLRVCDERLGIPTLATKKEIPIGHFGESIL